MRINRRDKLGLNTKDIEPHHEENPKDWRKNTKFRKAVIKINKSYGFSGRLKRR